MQYIGDLRRSFMGARQVQGSTRIQLETIKTFADALHQFVSAQAITIIVALRHHAEWLETWHN